MKTIAKLRNEFVFTISALVIAVCVPELALAVHYPEAGDPVSGAKIWAENCSRCHNARDPQDLRDDQWVTSVFHMRIRAGLTGQQTRDVLTFLQDSNVPILVKQVFDETSTSSESTMSGAEVYDQTCVACHGANGKGTVPGSPDFTRADGPLSKSGDTLLQNIKAGFKSPGSPMAMPPKGGNAILTDADIRSVLEYMRERFTH